MARYRPRRELAKRALELVRADPTRGVALVPEGEDGITPDTVLILVATINKLRDAYDDHHSRYELRDLVRTVCNKAPFDRARCYAYELVVMRYYTLLSQFAARLRRRRKPRRRSSARSPAPPFTLVA